MDIINNPNLHWGHLTGSPKFDYPIDFYGATLSARDDGHLDFAYRWAPNSYCHFHRHLCETTSTVISGELHITDFDDDGNELGTRVRGPGSYSHTSEHDVHMERGGPQGALVVFNLYAPDGLLAQTLANDLTVLHTSTAASVIKNWKRHNPS